MGMRRSFRYPAAERDDDPADYDHRKLRRHAQDDRQQRNRTGDEEPYRREYERDMADYPRTFSRGGRGPRLEMPIGSQRLYATGPRPDRGLFFGTREEGLRRVSRYPFEVDAAGYRSMGYGGYVRGHRGRGPRGYQRSDERIREDVCECLSEDPYIDASNMEVTVQNGEVTLAGSVDSRRCKREAADLIEELPGVRDVHNQLRIVKEPATDGMAASAQSRPRVTDD